MKKLMILGAGYSQLPLIWAAQRLGFHTLAASTPGDWPGFSAADSVVFADISDPQAVLAAAREHKIDGIATCCLDAGMAAIGLVCQTLGLVGPKARPAQTASNKYAMKEAFQKAGVQTARHICIRNKEELAKALKELPFPVILKAVDQMGSRGIFHCDTSEEAMENYEKTMAATKQDYCLVEEFIEGTLFGAEAMIKDQKLVYCLIDNTESHMAAVPSPIGHSLPFALEDRLGGQAREQVQKAIYATGLDNCPVNCDLIYKEDKVYVVEITGRAGGTCLPELVGLTFGIDYYEAIVRLAMGMEVEEMFQGKGCTACISRTLLSERDGILKEIRNENQPKKDVVDLSFNVSPGETVRRYTNGRDRLGQVILTGESLARCRERMHEILDNIYIELEG